MVGNKHVRCMLIYILAAFHFHFHKKQPAKAACPKDGAVIPRPCPIEQTCHNSEHCGKNGDNQYDWSGNQPLIYAK